MKGESSLWIITRSDLEFDEYSSIIRISKEDKSQNVHVSLGTFVMDKYNNLIFKIFSKQQLIDYSSNLKYLRKKLEINHTRKMIFAKSKLTSSIQEKKK